MSVTLETGVWLTISGPTNSGVPYLQYCGSSDVSSCALPKSQIRICSLLKSAIRRFSGYRTVQSRGEFGRRQGFPQGTNIPVIRTTPHPVHQEPFTGGSGQEESVKTHTHFDVQVQDTVLVQVANAFQDLPHVRPDLQEME